MPNILVLKGKVSSMLSDLSLIKYHRFVFGIITDHDEHMMNCRISFDY